MRRIGIVSAARGAGGRFFAANFACFLAEEGRRPAVLELGAPGLYDALGMDKRFAGRSFCPQGGPPNVAAGVNWALLVPDGDSPGAAGYRSEGESAGSDRYRSDGGSAAAGGTERGAAPADPAAGIDAMERFYRRLRLIDGVEGDVVLCLLNGLPGRERDLFLRDMDASFLLVDPLPSRLLAAESAIRTVRDEKKRMSPIVNKMNPGVKKHELYAYLGVRTVPEIPLVPPEEIYRAEYACRVPYEAKPVRDALRPPFARILRGL